MQRALNMAEWKDARLPEGRRKSSFFMRFINFFYLILIPVMSRALNHIFFTWTFAWGKKERCWREEVYCRTFMSLFHFQQGSVSGDDTTTAVLLTVREESIVCYTWYWPISVAYRVRCKVCNDTKWIYFDYFEYFFVIMPCSSSAIDWPVIFPDSSWLPLQLLTLGFCCFVVPLFKKRSQHILILSHWC